MAQHCLPAERATLQPALASATQCFACMSGCCGADDGASAGPTPSSLRSVLPAALAGPAVQRCDQCSHGVIAAWDTEAGVVASAYWLGDTGESQQNRGSSGDRSDRDQSAGWFRGLTKLQNGAAMGVHVASHPTADGTTLQCSAHVLPGARLVSDTCCSHIVALPANSAAMCCACNRGPVPRAYCCFVFCWGGLFCCKGKVWSCGGLVYQKYMCMESLHRQFRAWGTRVL